MKTRFQMDYDDDTTMGLNHYLSGMAEYEDVVYSTNIPNGYMVPCTQLLENPSALLEDVRFKELLNTLSENYRFVIIDSPPLGSVADGALIASLCDGAVLVVRAGTTPRTLIKQSLYEIQQSGCKLLGTVLNRADVKGRAYGKYGYGNTVMVMDTAMGMVKKRRSRYLAIYTIKDYDKEFQLYRLAFPNDEVRYGFFNFLVPYYTPVNEDEQNFYIGKFVQELRVGEVDAFLKGI